MQALQLRPEFLHVFRQLKQRPVRQLAWACFGPSLIQQWPVNISKRINPLSPWACDWLIQLDQDPKPLLHYLKTLRNARLGFLFEAYWQFYLQQNPQTRLLASNHQIHQQGQTLGAFDLLFINEQEQAVHLELALKFYLGVSGSTSYQSSNMGYWLGPSQHDSLASKYRHLSQQQLQLGQHPAAIEYLQELEIRQPPAKQAWMQGVLFQPLGPKLQRNKVISAFADYGLWCHLNQLQAWLEAQPDDLTSYPLKPSHWLAPAPDKQYELDAKQTLSYCADKLASYPQPVYLHISQAEQQYPLFVCPDGWLAQARQLAANHCC